MVAQTQVEKEVVLEGVKKLIKGHPSHNLVKLATEAGLENYATEEDLAYLVLLSSMNMQGRYPSHMSPGQVLIWEGSGGDPVRWDSLCDAIHKCFVANRPKMAF